MKKRPKPQKCVPLQEENVELNFPRGVHPSNMTPEESKIYWAWYTCDLPPLPKDDEDFDE